jgi:hypothetical protein
MKEVLQHVKDVLERSFDNPNAHDLDHCIRELEQAKAAAGDKAKMIDDVIRAVTHARNAQNELANAGDVSATNAFAEAHRAVDQAIESYTDSDNDPF